MDRYDIVKSQESSKEFISNNFFQEFFKNSKAPSVDFKEEPCEIYRFLKQLAENYLEMMETQR